MKKTFLLCVFILTVCSASAFGQQTSKDEKAIRDTLSGTAEGWNKGDLNQYLSAYVKEATEMLSTGPAGGVEVIEKTMKEGFWKTGNAGICQLGLTLGSYSFWNAMAFFDLPILLTFLLFLGAFIAHVAIPRLAHLLWGKE